MQSHSMLTLLFIAVLTVLFGYLSRTEAASTERPYQFGFTIEKQQHRQEKKDERGIVMGEFGFITADGIYHVTVYATDEEGKFRILAMRSYPYEENPKTIEMIVRPKAKPTTPKAIAPITPTERTKPKPFEKHNFSVQGCSGCFIKNDAPTTTTKKPEDKKYDISLLSRPLAPEETPLIGSAPPSSTLNGGKAKTPTIGAFGNANSPQGPAKTGTNAFAKPSSSQPSGGAKGSINGISTPKTQLTTPALNAGNTGGNTGGGKGNTAGAAGRPSTNTGFGGGSGGNKGFGVNNNFGGNSGSGTASGSKAGKAAVFGGSNAGSKAGSAAGSVGGSGGIGSTAGEAGDLYRFKYLLDYNGHRETGSHSGNKEGSFYAIGDDNVERTIEYIANEFGYQPRVRFRKLDAPVKATENTLKDYEFVWFKKA